MIGYLGFGEDPHDRLGHVPSQRLLTRECTMRAQYAARRRLRFSSPLTLDLIRGREPYRGAAPVQKAGVALGEGP
jgi:hypothetical protein